MATAFGFVGRAGGRDVRSVEADYLVWALSSGVADNRTQTRGLWSRRSSERDQHPSIA